MNTHLKLLFVASRCSVILSHYDGTNSENEYTRSWEFDH